MKLISDKKNCCGCEACVNKCPYQAIQMQEDMDGFLFPKINADKCVDCGLCIKVCDFQKSSHTRNLPKKTFALINNNKQMFKNSASGGAFSALADIVLKNEGIIFGATFNNKTVEHISVTRQEDLYKLQGSKYVQSRINNTYNEVKDYLLQNRWVLFSGTPCQIAGLNSYLGKDYDKLITVDLICHGVPNNLMLKKYLEILEDELKGTIIEFKFRPKNINAKGYNAKVIYKKQNLIQERLVASYESYYYNYFLNGYIYRESCYNCKYACENRVGDFTIGDYWGVEQLHPTINVHKGVSVLLANTEKSVEILEQLYDRCEIIASDFENVKKHNKQLTTPPLYNVKREEILKIWREGGGKSLQKYYVKNNAKRIIRAKIKRNTPDFIIRGIKKIKNI